MRDVDLNCTLILILFISLFSPLSFALEEIRWKESARGVEFYSLHSEGGAFFVDHFLAEPGKLQDRLSESHFSSEAQARAFFESQTRDFNSSDRSLLKNRLTINNNTEEPTLRIWPVVQEWDSSWEARFTEWIENEVTAEFLYDHNVAVDCADVAVSLRWIFARTHGLPVANHLAGSGVLFSNESFKEAWTDLPIAENWHEDSLFLAALDYVLKNTYTHSLINDLYPIEISTTYVAGGAIFLNLHSRTTGHTELVKDLFSAPEHPFPLRVLASTVPRAVRVLKEYGYRAASGSLESDKHGLFRFRWPKLVEGEMQLVEAEKMAGFSLDQFDSNFTRGYRDYAHAIVARLIPNWQPNIRELMRSLVALALEKLIARVQIVEEGYNYCSTHQDCVEGSASWEAWSTPSRDKSILSVQEEIYALYRDPACDTWCEREYTSKSRQQILRHNGRILRLGTALTYWSMGNFSSDPNDSISKRWGLGE